MSHYTDIFMRITVDWLANHAQNGVGCGKNVKLVVILVIFILGVRFLPHGFQTTLLDLAEVGSLLGVLESVLDHRKQFDFVVRGGHGQQVFLHLGVGGDAFGDEVPLDARLLDDDLVLLFVPTRLVVLEAVADDVVVGAD